jgi:hypothetical protein
MHGVHGFLFTKNNSEKPLENPKFFQIALFPFEKFQPSPWFSIKLDFNYLFISRPLNSIKIIEPFHQSPHNLPNEPLNISIFIF